MDENHPALVAARKSWHCAQTRAREEWLDLMADDIVIEDPIGVGPTNPTGEGVRGKAAVSEFFDQNLAKSDLKIETHESFAAGNESAHRLTLRMSYPGGTTVVVNGIFTYTVNDAGKLTNLRGYWSMDDMLTE